MSSMHIDILDYMGTQRFYNQQPISKESFFEIRDANDSSHRKVFSLKTAVQKNKQAGKIPSIYQLYLQGLEKLVLIYHPVSLRILRLN